MNKCHYCGTPFGLVPVVYKLNGKRRDHSYYAPACKCLEIMAEKKEKKEVGQRKANRIKELLDCGIAPVYKNKTFSNYNRAENPNAYDVCRQYARHFGEGTGIRGIFLTGYVGTGKTHLAVSIVDHVARIKHRKIASFILFESVPELMDRIRERRSMNWLRNTLNACDLLVLDDLGTEHITDWSIQIMHDIVDIRYRIKKHTIITTNLSLEEVREEYGERMFSRIYEMCQGVKFTGKDYRLCE